MGEEYRNAKDATRTIADTVMTNRNPTTYQQTVASSIRESKYMKLLSVIQDLGSHIKPFYAGRRYATEEVKNCISNARTLVMECLHETRANAYKENEYTLNHK